MKRCPHCYQPYADSQNFCELDGRPLLDLAAISPGKVVDAQTVPDVSARKPEAGVMVVVGVMVGMVLTSLAYAGYALLAADPAAKEQSVPVSRVETTDSRQPTRPQRTAIVEPSPAPEEEESPSPEPEAEPENSPAAEAATVAARLNQGPVSTGERESKREDRSDKTIIEMNDGTRVEVDAAWQDKQGVWYRRGGLVSFVESSRIKSIQGRQEAKADPVNTQSP